MRYSGKLTLVFLLVLYIGPMLFISSYGHTAIPAEPNMHKDFSLASEWYSESWLRRMNVSINGSSGAGVDYQVIINVTYDSDMKADFGDIRFTDNDGITLIAYWMESYVASTFAVFWVEVKDDLGSSQVIFMYYGNPAVSTTSNGPATFLFYEDWATETVITEKWDTITSDGSISFDNTDANHGSVLKMQGNAGVDVYELRTDSTVAGTTSLIGRLNLESTVAASQRVWWGMGSTAAAPLALVRSVDGTEDFLVFDDDSNSLSDALGAGYFDVYQNFMITRDGTNAKLYSDYSLVSTLSMEPDIVANVVASMYVRDSEYDLYCDWIAQRKFIATEPIFDSFGDEEPYIPPYWHIINSPILLFSVSFDMWGFDTALIILGLVMIPVSTIFLAYSAKNDRSSDRLFYGLIIFMVGCGLFIGGVLP